ncbi:MAG TPA: hypothetical protein VIF62_10020 [Labilithrix sp.]
MTKTTFVAVLGVAAACAIFACLGSAFAKKPPLPVTAAIDGADVSRESRIDDRWFVRFENPNDVACRIVRYRVAWTGGGKTLEPRELSVPAHGRTVRSIALPASAVGTARIDVDARC